MILFQLAVRKKHCSLQHLESKQLQRSRINYNIFNYSLPILPFMSWRRDKLIGRQFIDKEQQCVIFVSNCNHNHKVQILTNLWKMVKEMTILPISNQSHCPIAYPTLLLKLRSITYCKPAVNPGLFWSSHFPEWFILDYQVIFFIDIVLRIFQLYIERTFFYIFVFIFCHIWLVIKSYIICVFMIDFVLSKVPSKFRTSTHG